MQYWRSLFAACTRHARSLGLLLLTTLFATSALPPTLHAVPRKAVPAAGTGMTYGVQSYKLGWFFMPNSGTPDIIIQDCGSDVGNEPNGDCGYFWASPGIYVRNSIGAAPAVHQNPIPGQPNYIYAQVQNIGSGTLVSGRVHFYVAKASTGLTWPTSWINNYSGGVLYGDEIGSVAVSNLPAGGVTTVGVLWNNVPDPANYNDPDARHFCLLARFVSDEDPMTYAEGWSTPANTQNNNNIAWKNISLMDCQNPRAALDIANNIVDDLNGLIRFEVPKEELEDPVTKHCTLTVDLGEELYALWEQGGKQGEGIGEYGDGRIIIYGTEAWIGGLRLRYGERYTMHPEIFFNDDGESEKTYHWNIVQYNQDKDELIGGETYEIRTRCRADGMIRDCDGDAGAEPDFACGGVYWASPAIYVRNQQDGLLPGAAVHQNPIAIVDNWVYVQVKNIGERILNNATVRLYYSKASTGLVWPASWGNNHPYSEEIGTATISGLGPNQSATVEIKWSNVPDPNDFGDPDARHFCLLARLESAEDPMTFPEGLWVLDNTRNNNNIAWKNVSIMDCDYPRAAIDIYNGTEEVMHTALRFDVPEEDGEDHALNHFGIRVDLGQALYEQWKEGGNTGEGIEDQGDGTLFITAPHAWIGGLRLRQDERHTMHVETEYYDKEDEAARDNYRWTITQYRLNQKTQEAEPVGGETYDLRRKCRPDALIRDYVGDAGAQPNLSLYGNFWSSPDIYVRNQNDGLINQVHQNAIGGQDNWVYVRLKNVGNKTLGSGMLHLYYAKASTGLVWPSSFQTGFPYGEEIDVVPVTGLAKNNEIIVPIKWQNVPDPSQFGDPDAHHFCLLARFESAEDPIIGEGLWLSHNVPYNSNIAQKNISIMDCRYRRAAVDIFNGTKEEMETELRFDVPNEDGDDNALAHFNIRVELGAYLTEVWRERGMQGTGVEYDQKEGLIITSPHAWIGGLTIKPEDRHTIYAEFEPTDEAAGDETRDGHAWTITQYRKGDLGPIGGETYDLRRTCGANVMIRDCNSDIGTEPDLACGGVYWASPAIYVRNQDDGLVNPVHQNPIGGTGNWVYVQVKNIGSGTLNNGQVEVYFAKASTGLSWPSSWTGPYPYGGYINSATVSNLLPGASATVKIYWPNAPAPGWFSDPDARHFCMLARFVSAEDPMTYPEGSSVLANVRDNNNIAWKNMTIMDCTNPRAALDLLNPAGQGMETELRFTTPEEDGDDNALAHFAVTVDLGQALMEQWRAAGEPGEGVERGEGTNIVIAAPRAWIGGLQLRADQRQTIHVAMRATDGELTRPYRWNVTQHAAGDDTPIGGETYEFTRGNCTTDVMIRDCDADNGAEPSIACATHWESPAIYVRRQPDGFSTDVHEDPVAGRTNYVYVKVKNIGTTMLGNGQVHVYYAKASTGFVWSSNWIGNYPYGDEIGSATVSWLAAGGETIVEIPWTGLPNLSDPDRHFCLLARFVSAEDPMHYPETSVTGDNVYYNNNIAQKNIAILGCSNRRVALQFQHNADDATNQLVTFDVPEDEGNGILDHGPIRVQGGDDEWNARLAVMIAAGMIQGEGYEMNETGIWITEPHAWMEGFPIEMNPTLIFTMPDCDGSGTIYHWRVAQYETGDGRPTGGETFVIGTEEPITIIPCGDRFTSFEVQAPYDMYTELRFNTPNPELFDNGPIRVELGYELYALWEQEGEPGSGVSPVGDGTSIWVYDQDAWIGPIWLEARKSHTVRIEMPPCDYSGNIYQWTISQHDEGNPDPIRSKTVDVYTWDEFGKPARPEKGDLSNALQLSARPNPFNTATAIGFTLPNESSVTLAIYDATGRMVRTLLAGDNRGTGRHEISWDGTTADGTPVPAGTYFYRLSTSLGTTVEQQLQIVR